VIISEECSKNSHFHSAKLGSHCFRKLVGPSGEFLYEGFRLDAREVLNVVQLREHDCDIKYPDKQSMFNEIMRDLAEAIRSAVQ
jgi:hypothetical protein